MHKFWEKYASLRAELMELKKDVPNRFSIGLFSLLLSVIIFMGPIVCLVNCFIFVDYMLLIIYALAFCLFGIIYLTMFFYNNFIANKRVENMSVFHLANLIYCLIGYIAAIIVLYVF